ncbi:NitT/TauT family transport system permease protein [Planifilum fimeticola]|jgi:NitT/TauT family transport system permease protein|uniref:NitT/TauT family transport system permease protein n=1 Tax=Planifilum fimeticola TaxID=201975 RepID=A0A2T0LBZ6_9BACL|nr:ABC transporter permease [Planifilum fimeticola]PRX39464.1 NitT/TauT family transport system permease protein [Planifilum fimeticola]
MTNGAIKRWLERGAVSPLHAKHLRRLRIREWKIAIYRTAILLLLIIGWEWAAREGVIDPFLFSSPGQMWDLAVSLSASGELLNHIAVTLVETLIGFSIGTAAGTALATLIWASPMLSRVLDPYLVVLNSMPKVALGPLFIVTIGAGYGSIIAMGVAITIIITALVMHQSFKSANPDHLILARAFGATRTQQFIKIILPSSIPDLIAAIKVNVGLSWVGVIVGEFLVSKAGLGYLIIYGFQVFNLTLVMLNLLIVALLATLMYLAVSRVEKHLLRHRETNG